MASNKARTRRYVPESPGGEAMAKLEARFLADPLFFRFPEGMPERRAIRSMPLRRDWAKLVRISMTPANIPSRLRGPRRTPTGRLLGHQPAPSWTPKIPTYQLPRRKCQGLHEHGPGGATITFSVTDTTLNVTAITPLPTLTVATNPPKGIAWDVNDEAALGMAADPTPGVTQLKATLDASYGTHSCIPNPDF